MTDGNCMRTTHLWHSYLKVQKNMIRCLQESACREDISVQQYLILMTFYHHGELSQKLMREKTFLPKSTLSQAIEGLVKDGMVVRETLESDRREMGLSLNSKGTALVQRIQQDETGLLQTFSDIVAEISEDDYHQILSMNEQIITKLEEKEGESTC